MTSWIQQLISMYAENEAPEKYFYWSGITAISAVIKKRLYLDRHHYKLYPNIYTLIVGHSGIKKGLPIKVCKDLVTKTDSTRVVAGRKSIQRVIQDFGKAYTLQNGTVIHNAQGILISSELAAFLVKDPDAMTILTELYGTHEHEEFWENSLKSTGVDKLKAPCFTLLGATNEEHFSEAVPSKDVGGGFIARSFIVLGTERSQLNSLTRAPLRLPDLDCMVEYLKEISKLEGEFKWSDKAIILYDNWYYDFYSKKYNDPTGSISRLGDQILKVAMLISLSEDISLEIKDNHIFEAITVCEECINGMIQVTMSKGSHSLAAATKIIMRELILCPIHQLSKMELLKKHFGEFDDFDITRIAETLQASGAIEIIPQGKTTIYKMTKKTLEMYADFKKGIQ